MEDAALLTLKSVHLSHFRGFCKPKSFEMGQITVIGGANGLGKTTVFDAIDWTLFGNAWRLGEDGDQTASNLWSPCGPDTRVDFGSGILRRIGTTAELDGATFHIEDLLLDPSIFATSALACVNLRRLCYLPQEEIREVVTAKESYRTGLLAALSGVPYAERFERNVENTLRDIDGSHRSARLQVEALNGRKLELEERQKALSAKSDRLSSVRAVLETDLHIVATGRPTELAVTLADHIASREAVLRQIAKEADAVERLAQLITAAQSRSDEISPRRALFSEQATDTEKRLAVLSRDERALREDLLAEAQKIQTAEARKAKIQERVNARQLAASAAAEREASRLRAEAVKSELGGLRVELDDVRRKLVIAEEYLPSDRELETQLEKDLAAAREAVRRRQHRQALEPHSQELDGKVSLLLQQRQAVDAKIEAARDAVAVASDERQRLVSEERIQSMLRALLQEMQGRVQESICPICSHDHGRPEVLDAGLQLAFARLDSIRGKRAADDPGEKERAARIRLEQALTEQARLNSAIGEASDELHICKAELASSQGAEAVENGVEEVENRLKEVIERRAVAEQVLRHSSVRKDFLAKRIAELESLSARMESTQAERDAAPPPTGPEGSDADDQAELAAVSQNLSTMTATAAERNTRLIELHRQLEESTQQHAQLSSELRRCDSQLNVLAQELKSAKAEAASHGFGDIEADAEALQWRGTDLRRKEADLRAELGQAHALLIDVESAVQKPEEIEGVEKELSDILAQVRAVEADAEQLDRSRRRLAELAEAVRREIGIAARVARVQSEGAINKILQRLNPHRHLNILELAADGGLGLRDTDLRLPHSVPAHPYTSTGQTNCVALALFLGMALSFRAGRLGFLLLDEPVQNLDDVNLLNFVDVLRQVGMERQVILSTAERNLFELLKKKLSVWGEVTGKTVVFHKLTSFTRDGGPEFLTEKVGFQRAAA